MTGETIVITRPKGDEASLRDALHDGGYAVIHEPLTEIFLRHTERPTFHIAMMSDPDAIIVTSRHGVQALALLTEFRDIFLICVGQATADIAHSLGFTRVSAAGGDGEKLIRYIAEGYDEGSRFIYVSGEHIRSDLVSRLADIGMQAQRIVAYDALAAPHLSDTLIEQLKRRQIDAVTFMSPRACHIWTRLLASAKVQDSVKHIGAFALSASVAEPLVEAPWRRIHIADEATLASLVRSVDNIYQR